MEDRQHSVLPEIGEAVALVFQGQPFGPDMDPDTKQMVMSLNTFKGIFKGVAVEPLDQNGVSIWFIGSMDGSIVWRLKRDQILMWTPMPSLNRA
jgi:hypothetical protein